MAYQYLPAYPNGKQKAFTVSYDDGNTCDEPLVEMLRKHHAKGAFNINSGMFGSEKDVPQQNSWRRMSAEECLALYGDDMEIAVHGVQHPFWNCMSSVNAMQDILDDKRALEQLSGRIIRGAAFPYGKYNDDVIEILRLAGFAYCRAVRVTKKFVDKENPLCFHGTVRNRDPEAIELAHKFAESPVPFGRTWLYYLWGHSYEFVQDNSWNVLEEILSIACDRADVWYCTNIEYFDYVAAAKQLRWSVDQTLVENPSALDVWIMKAKKFRDPEPEFLKIPAGKTVKV